MEPRWTGGAWAGLYRCEVVLAPERVRPCDQAWYWGARHALASAGSDPDDVAATWIFMLESGPELKAWRYTIFILYKFLPTTKIKTGPREPSTPSPLPKVSSCSVKIPVSVAWPCVPATPMPVIRGRRLRSWKQTAHQTNKWLCDPLLNTFPASLMDQNLQTFVCTAVNRADRTSNNYIDNAKPARSCKVAFDFWNYSEL